MSTVRVVMYLKWGFCVPDFNSRNGLNHWTQFWAIPLLTNLWWFFKVEFNIQRPKPKFWTFEKPDSSLYICRRQLERAGHILRPIITCTISRNIMIFRRRPSHRKIMWSFGDDFPQWVKKNTKKVEFTTTLFARRSREKKSKMLLAFHHYFQRMYFFLYLLSVDTLWILLHLWNDDLKVHFF